MYLHQERCIIKGGKLPMQNDLQKNENPLHEAVRESQNDVPVLPATWQALQKFQSENQQMFYKYVLKRIRKAVELNANVAILFVVQNEVASINKPDFHAAIENIKLQAIEFEDYATAWRCVKLLDQHAANTLIDEIKGG